MHVAFWIKTIGVKQTASFWSHDPKQTAVRKLKPGKNDGNNVLSSEFFKNAPCEMFVHLALLFTATIFHGVIPDDLCCGTIIPIPKPGLSLCESASYRSQFHNW